ncbi:unnamed protein product [Cochlearia groenlandica]
MDVYGEDRYKRIVEDVYTDEKFIQQEMMTNGDTWYYETYEKYSEFTMEIEARKKRVGLWAHPNPEKP